MIDATSDDPTIDPDDDSLALAASAAALALGAADPIGPMPTSLRARVVADADRHFERIDRRGRPSTPVAWKVAAGLGWVAAAASWLALGWPAWTPARRPADGPARVAARGWIAPLKASDHPLAGGARGEVAWDQGSQSGELRLRGLAGVDPGKGVYQLWIFDSARDPRYPIDGGVFTVADPSVTTTVPVRAKLPVARPGLFAITLEPPGGVVVSDRRRIMLSAAHP